MLMRKPGKNKMRQPWVRKLRAIREKYGLTQREAAERTGVALRTWINWENAQRPPSKPMLRLLQLTFPGDI